MPAGSFGLRTRVNRCFISSHGRAWTIVATWACALPAPSPRNSEGSSDTRQQVRELYKVAIPVVAIAHAIAYAIERPTEVEIDEIVIRPTAQEF